MLFALARDAEINVDVNPDVTGVVSINAIEQTLPQILERISRQADMRWSMDEFGNIVVEADSPIWRNYKVDYVDVTRTATTDTQVSTSIAGATGSSSSLNQTSASDFWVTLQANLGALLNTSVAGGVASDSAQWVIANPEAGVITIRGTSRQHEVVAAFLDSVQTRALYQVLIEATVVEVDLKDNYQGGVDWSLLARNNGEVSFVQNVASPDLTTDFGSILTIDRSTTPDAISATISLLSQFGELRVLSSPKIMTLNNQATILRRVDNEVYFTIDVEPAVIGQGVATEATFTTTATTVPVGFVMTVTPQISDNDQVTLNVRPTISRIIGYVNDPNPALADANVTNRIPQTQVSEMESVLKVYSGQVAILGGLMQDSIQTGRDGRPRLSRLPGAGDLFSYRNDRARKTELIIFIRPVVIRQPSLQGDLQDYRDYLPANGLEPTGPSLPEGLLSLPGGE